VNLTFLPRKRVLVMLLAIAAGLVLCTCGGLAGGELLCLAPALVLAAILCARRYPGERLLCALARRGSERRPRQRSARAPFAPAKARVPRGGLLMGFALAVRPPPAGLAT
jgi:hypothetical protein